MPLGSAWLEFTASGSKTILSNWINSVGLFLSSMANKNSTLRCTFSAPSHSATLLQGLSVLRAHGQLLDVVLAINEERFQVHRAVLAACSDYFRFE